MRQPSQRSISAAALERQAGEVRAALAAATGVFAADVDATALPGGASVYVDVTMPGTPLEALTPALETIRSALARAWQATAEVPPLEESAVLSVRADRQG